MSSQKFFYVRFQFSGKFDKVSDSFVCAKCYADLIGSLNSPCDHDTQDVTGDVPPHIKECEDCGQSV